MSDLIKRLLREADSALGKPLCDGGQLFREAAKRITELKAETKSLKNAAETAFDITAEWRRMCANERKARLKAEAALRELEELCQYSWISCDLLRDIFAKYKEEGK